MSIEQAVRQAIAAGAIAQSTIDELQRKVITSADTRALAILGDAVSSGLVMVMAEA